MLRNKAKLDIVSKILRHSSVAITLDVYRHIYDEEILEEVEPHVPMSDAQPALERGPSHKDIPKAQLHLGDSNFLSKIDLLCGPPS